MNLKQDVTAVGVLGTGGAEVASKDGLVQVLTSEQVANAHLCFGLSIGAVVSILVMFGTVCYALHRVFLFGCAVYDRVKDKTNEPSEV